MSGHEGELVRPGVLPAGAAGAGVGGWVVPGVLGGAMAIACVGAAVWIRRRRIGRDPAGHAFRVVSRRLRLSRAERARVVELSKAHGHAAPVALLLSEHAFRTAVAAGGASKSSGAAAEVAGLRGKVFG